MHTKRAKELTTTNLPEIHVLTELAEYILKSLISSGILNAEANFSPSSNWLQKLKTKYKQWSTTQTDTHAEEHIGNMLSSTTDHSDMIQTNALQVTVQCRSGVDPCLIVQPLRYHSTPHHTTHLSYLADLDAAWCTCAYLQQCVPTLVACLDVNEKRREQDDHVGVIWKQGLTSLYRGWVVDV